jgi:AcrR family transcriptional regulator
MATAEKTTRSDAKRNRAAILAAARRLFARSGEVPTYEIARAAGVGQGTLYRHFPDRRSIAIAVFDEELAELERLAAEHADDPEAFFVLVRAVVEIQARLQGLVETIHEETPSVQSEKEALKDRLMEIFAKPFGDARSAGALRSDIATEDLFLVMAMVDGSLIRRAEDADPGETASRALTIALEGLRSNASG